MLSTTSKPEHACRKSMGGQLATLPTAEPQLPACKPIKLAQQSEELNGLRSGCNYNGLLLVA